MSFQIETKRLRLRPFALEDAKAYFKLTKDPAIRKYVPYACFLNIKDTRNIIKEAYSKGDLKHDFYLVIEKKSNDKIIGALIITEDMLMNSYYNACYLIGKRYRRKGYMKEALQGFIKNVTLPGTIIFEIMKNNYASLQLIQQIPGIKEFNLPKCCPVKKQEVSFFSYTWNKN